MPRAERLSSRLDTLLEAVFDSPSDPLALYWDIAAQLRRGQLAQVQAKIRKTLRQRGEIGAESAMLLACILHLTGFPAHRLLHFLSLYIPGGIPLSLFELAVTAIFRDEPPIPARLLYDLTQYTYLEKRLLVRKSIEISDTLRGSLTPAVLLHLYLLSLRDDLSNENIQLIALIMKNCFPGQEVRTRLGGASLEEYGEIARAWKSAERRSLDLDLNRGSGAPKQGTRAFDRDSASFFLDKYFSDKALSEMRASAPAPPKRRAPPRPAAARTREEPRNPEETLTMSPDPRAEAPAVPAEGGEPRRRPPKQAAPKQAGRAPGKKTAGSRSAVNANVPAPTEEAQAAPHSPRSARAERGFRRRLLRLAPAVCAAAVMAFLAAFLLLRMPASGSASAAAAPQPPTTAAVNDVTSSVAEAPPAPAAPETTTYVVRPGDSLWKIFTSMRAQNGDRRGWMDFLLKTQSMNGLADPDRLQPGKVLTLSAQK